MRWWTITLIGLALTTVSDQTRAASAKDYLGKPDAWFRSDEGRRITANILSWQSKHGSWPKNTDTASKPFTGNRGSIQGTFDNGATTDELRYLARAYRVTKSKEFGKAFQKGLVHILKAQYPTGGWPQFYPVSRYYHRHITFNDNAMVRVMQFLRDVADSKDFAFLPPSVRTAARESFDRGVQCILKCQIVVNGKRTVWCAQHDEKTLKPRKGRSYELASLSGGESVGILRLLMSIEDPSQEVVDAIVAGAGWYKTSEVTDRDAIRAAGVKGPGWGRFYDIASNRPIFSGRDGKKKFSLSDIERERAEGYMWWGRFGDSVAREFAKWKRKHAKDPRILIEGTGIIPEDLPGPLRTAYALLLRKQYGQAARTLQAVLDKPEQAGEQAVKTARTMMKLVELRAADTVRRLDRLEEIGDYYALSLWLFRDSRRLKGLPGMAEKIERWQAAKSTEKWRRGIRAGQDYDRLMRSADHKVTPLIVQRLEGLAGEHPKALYGQAAADAATKLKADPKASPAKIREAYFRKRMAQ